VKISRYGPDGVGYRRAASFLTKGRDDAKNRSELILKIRKT